MGLAPLITLSRTCWYVSLAPRNNLLKGLSSNLRMRHATTTTTTGPRENLLCQDRQSGKNELYARVCPLSLALHPSLLNSLVTSLLSPLPLLNSLATSRLAPCSVSLPRAHNLPPPCSPLLSHNPLLSPSLIHLQLHTHSLEGRQAALQSQRWRGAAICDSSSSRQ